MFSCFTTAVIWLEVRKPFRFQLLLLAHSQTFRRENVSVGLSRELHIDREFAVCLSLESLSDGCGRVFIAAAL